MNNQLKTGLIIAVAVVFLWLIGLTVALSVMPKGAPEGSDTGLTAVIKPATQVPVTVTSYGYTAFKLTSGTLNVLIDPWITGNMQGTIKPDDTLPVDLILVSDGHDDHVGDTVAIAKRSGAKVITTPDIAAKLVAGGLAPANILHEGSGINTGSEIQVQDIKVVMTATSHSTTGIPAVGYVVKFPGNATVYYAGETGIFGDMKVIADLYPIHVALLPIGGVSTMDAYQAVKSLELLKPSKVIPMRYGAVFPKLAPTADPFLKLALQDAPGSEVIILKPNESYILKPGVYR
jgi:L-ascorbate metabolism protein UlaG (beta-lactamase superfamily)